MIKLDLKNLLFPSSFLNIKYSYAIKKAMSGLLEKHSKGKLGFIDVDIDPDLDKINSFVDKSKSKYDDVVILGIGGSALGARAIMTAIKGKYYNSLSKEKRNGYAKLHILDNVDPIEIKNLIEIIDYKRTLFIIISKSGKTLETISQFQFFKNELKKNNIKYEEHFVVIAGENSGFKDECLERGLEVFDIPDNVGGRFSVFTNVGLLPLALIGVDITLLLKGVSNVKEDYLKSDITKNNALLTSLIQYHSYIELGKNITIFFPYISNFSFVGQWYKQLIGESLGKQGIGVTLTDSIGVTDQHSQLQLYYDGPNDKLVMFLELEDFETDYNICDDEKFTFSDLMHTEKIGTEQSISEYNKINYTLKLDKLNEESIGELFVFFEFQTAILGELYGFDAFDQPGVEIGKQITKEKLIKNIGRIDLLEGIIK